MGQISLCSQAPETPSYASWSRKTRLSLISFIRAKLSQSAVKLITQVAPSVNHLKSAVFFTFYRKSFAYFTQVCRKIGGKK